MANSLVHRTEIIDRRVVEWVSQLDEALDEMIGGRPLRRTGAGEPLPPGERSPDMRLSETYVMEIVEETLSDGSVASELRIRLAERV